MRIRVRAFSTLRDRLGDAETTLDCDEGTSVHDALEALEHTHDGLRGELLVDGTIPTTVTVLYDGTRVPNEDPDSVALAAGGELVLAPPVTGG